MTNLIVGLALAPQDLGLVAVICNHTQPVKWTQTL